MVLFILSLRSRPGLKLKTNDADRRTLRYDRKNRRGEDPLTFFGVQALPQPQIDPELLTSVDAAQAANDWNAELLNILDMAMSPRSGESAVDDFAAGFFRAQSGCPYSERSEPSHLWRVQARANRCLHSRSWSQWHSARSRGQTFRGGRRWRSSSSADRRSYHGIWHK